MKKGAQYIRVSDEDQSNFSISGQDRFNRKWAKQENVELVATFEDDGKSGKNFDRPDWKKLEAFLKKNAHEIDYLVFIKYDRFSRNLLEALVQIEKLEKKYNIFIEASLQPIGIPRSHPEYFKRRAQYLLDAEDEWHRIRDRTIMGIHEANMEGRYVNHAPYGYKNIRDAEDRPCLEIVPSKAAIIENIFNDFMAGHSMQVIKKKAQDAGFPRRGKSAIQRVLTTPTYAGLIRVAAYRDDEERIVKGIHTGIISEETYWKVQDMLAPRNRFRTILNDEFPLRGLLLCRCQKPLTGAKSKGKKVYVPYYKCNYHTGSNHNANKVHGQMEEIMADLSFSTGAIDIIRELIVSGLQQDEAKTKEEAKQLKAQLKDLDKKIDDLEGEYLSKNVDKETYDKWLPRYRSDRAKAKAELKAIETPAFDVLPMVDEEIKRLSDLRYVYQCANVTQKQSLVAWVFDSKLTYDSGTYRTQHMHPMFIDKALLLKQKGLLVYEKPFDKLQNPALVPGAGHQSNPNIIDLLLIIKDIKAA